MFFIHSIDYFFLFYHNTILRGAAYVITIYLLKLFADFSSLLRKQKNTECKDIVTLRSEVESSANHWGKHR